MTFLFYALVFGSLSLVESTGSGGGPFFPNVNGTDTSYPYRQNWCALRDLYMNGTRSPWTILKDQTVYFGVDPWAQDNIGSGAYLFINESTGYPLSGQSVDVINELSAKMGFKAQWVNLLDTPKMDGYFTPYLGSAVKFVDIYATDQFWDTQIRRGLNIGRLPPLGIDAIELVATQGSVVTELELWAFGIPFSSELWMVMVAVLVVNGFLLRLFRPPEQAELTVWHYLYTSLNAFAGEKLEADHNIFAMILTIGFNFMLLILVSSYVANLAAVLITTSTSSVLSVNSFQEAVDKGLPLCIQAGTAPVALIKAVYPTIKLNEQKGPLYVLGPNMGLCAGYISGTSSIQAQLTTKATNPKCNLVQAKSVGAYAPYSHSYYSADFDRKCTTFLADMLSVGMQQLIQEDLPALSMQRQLAARNDLDCPASEASTLTIPISKLIGIFALYAIFAATGVTLFYARKFYYWYTKPKALDIVAETELSGFEGRTGLGGEEAYN